MKELESYKWVIVAALAMFAFGCVAGFLGTETLHRVREAASATANYATAVQMERTMEAILRGTEAAWTATAAVATGTPMP